MAFIICQKGACKSKPFRCKQCFGDSARRHLAGIVYNVAHHVTAQASETNTILGPPTSSTWSIAMLCSMELTEGLNEVEASNMGRRHFANDCICVWSFRGLVCLQAANWSMSKRCGHCSAVPAFQATADPGLHWASCKTCLFTSKHFANPALKIYYFTYMTCCYYCYCCYSQDCGY